MNDFTKEELNAKLDRIEYLQNEFERLFDKGENFIVKQINTYSAIECHNEAEKLLNELYKGIV